MLLRAKELWRQPQINQGVEGGCCLVECNLANVVVAGSNPVARSSASGG
ncbi:MAG: hypothetical protein QME51_08675 [Planctomycetota bacterium]|nr:hypothetical protein [Planctomycetota bacterium]